MSIFRLVFSAFAAAGLVFSTSSPALADAESLAADKKTLDDFVAFKDWGDAVKWLDVKNPAGKLHEHAEEVYDAESVALQETFGTR